MGNLMAHVGLGDYVSVELAVALIQPGSITAKRRVNAARKLNQYIDCSHGKGIRSYILMRDNTVIAAHLTPNTLARRFANPFTASGDVDDTRNRSSYKNVITNMDTYVGNDNDIEDEQIPFADIEIEESQEEFEQNEYYDD